MAKRNADRLQDLPIEARIRRGIWLHAGLTYMGTETRGQVARLYDVDNFEETVDSILPFTGLQPESADAESYLRHLIREEAGIIIEYYESLPH